MESVFSLCAAIPGIVLLVTGLVKALAPTQFVAFLGRLQLLPPAWRYGFTGLAAFVQCLLGWALVAQVQPAFTLPLAMAVLSVLAGFTLWAMLRHQTDDCGCYGALATVPPKISLLLDALYVALLAAAWMGKKAASPAPLEQVNGLLLLAGGALFLAPVCGMGVWAGHKWQAGLLDLSPLRRNRVWNPDWAEGWAQLPTEEQHLVVLLRQGCKVCREWARPLQRVAQREDLPAVVGLLAGTPEEAATYAADHGYSFPVLAVKPATMDRLTNSYPTVVQLRHGRIVGRLEGRLPDEVLEKLRNATHPARPIGMATREEKA